MGKTTDSLIELAHKISNHPNTRELDMLLTTGERVSMALLSMALHDLNCPSISFTGSQAGIMTDGVHFNAKISDVKPIRVEEALLQNKLVVLAGFQGVDPKTKEITTLGRGGSDTTAVALAAHFKAARCEILKEVDGVYTADPKIVADARLIRNLPTRTLLNMCFWGAKVLHFRSVELALRLNVDLAVGRADTFKLGTHILSKKGEAMPFEETEVVSVNALPQVERIEISCTDSDEGLTTLQNILAAEKISWPQMLATNFEDGKFRALFTADPESLNSIQHAVSSSSKVKWLSPSLSAVTISCFGAVSSNLASLAVQLLAKSKIHVQKTILGPVSLSLFVRPEDANLTLQNLHTLVKKI
jgi:aspartate kinase